MGELLVADGFPALPTSGDQTKMDIAIYFIPTR